VLDLRSNSGGYSNAAVSASGAFSGPGAYLFLRDKLGNLEYYVYSGKTVTEDAVVVLMDGGSASASEALAANIRDTQRGILVGTRTFGKGVAQVILDGESYPDRFDNDALKVTAYRFYSTNGTTTDQIGVIPTLMTDNQSAYDIAMALCGSFRNDYVTEGQMMLQIAGQYYFIDPASMSAETASALLAALPPVAQLYVGAHTYNWEEISPEQAAELLNTSYSSRYFSDVSSSPYADEINTLATYYLLLGDGKGHFMPENQLTRAQVCAMLSHLLGVTYSGPSQFSDVDPSAWYADEVNAMAYLGFVEGVGNGRFQPDSVLTQQEFFTILGRMARYLNFNVDNYAATFYDDNGTCLLDYNPLLDGFADWAKEETALLIWSSEALSASGSMLFTDPEHLTPTAPISREEAAACMYRMLAILDILPA